MLSVKPHITLERTALVSGDGTLALTNAQWSMTGTLPNGESFSQSGKSVEVVRRQPDGSWLFVFDSGA
jgi:ketosteroid isomerase-like protein